jgi:hypothetical protein
MNVFWKHFPLSGKKKEFTMSVRRYGERTQINRK